MSDQPTPPSPRRSDDRILDTAMGVLVALRRCGLSHAFFDLAQTARQHGLAPVSLADALVVMAARQATDDCDQCAIVVARRTWGWLLDRSTPQPAAPQVNRLRHTYDESVWRAADDDDDAQEVLG